MIRVKAIKVHVLIVLQIGTYLMEYVIHILVHQGIITYQEIVNHVTQYANNA